MHYTMGGMWVNAEDQATNVPGIYAAGECEYQYHGANRLGANSLVSCIFGGGIAGPAAVKYARNLEKGTDSISSAVFDHEQKRQEAKNARAHRAGRLRKSHHHLERTRRGHDRARHCDAHQQKSRTRLRKARRTERALPQNQSQRPHQAGPIKRSTSRANSKTCSSSRASSPSARFHRNESRGAHYKPDFPDRDDANWLKTTRAKWINNEIELTYEPVDISQIPPRPRRYDAAK